MTLKFWNRFKNKAQAKTKDISHLHAGIEVSYGIPKGEKEIAKREQSYSSDLELKGYKHLVSSLDSDETNTYSYKATIYVNEANKEIIVATAGTKFNDVNDLFDDAKLSFGYVPSKIAPMQKLLDKALEKISNPEEYSFTTTGHSLGAVMSDLTAAEIMSRGLKVKESITFENPGAKKVVETAAKHNMLSGEAPQIEDLSEVCQEFLAKKNLINSAGKHLGKINMTLTDVNPEKAVTIDKSGFSSFFSNIGSSIKDTILKFTGVKYAKDLVKEHTNGNFGKDIEMIPVADWGADEMPLDIDAKELKNHPSTGKGFFAISEEDNDEFDAVSISSWEGSLEDLRGETATTIETDIDEGFVDVNYDFTKQNLPDNDFVLIGTDGIDEGYESI